jgi:hypothetical protein
VTRVKVVSFIEDLPNRPRSNKNGLEIFKMTTNAVNGMRLYKFLNLSKASW